MDYQKEYRIKHHERIKQLQQIRYKILSSEYIICPFCGKDIMLYSAKQHLKTKKCKKIQELTTDFNDTLIKFYKTINEVKTKLLYEDEL